MHLLRKIFTATTGYYIHKVSRLPIGTDLFVDIHRRMRYGSLKIIFDVGANVGQTWEWFRSNERNGKIYCFEPVLESFTELKSKTQKDKNCIVENIAFGTHAGEKSIALFSQNSVLNSLRDDIMNPDSNAKKEIIKIDTLDDYCFKNRIEKIDLLKIDTEGYELNVLEGAKEILNSGAISFIYCETGFVRSNNRNTYFADLTEWLAIRDYHFYCLYKLVSNGSKIEFGNALFVHKNVFTS